MKNYFKLAAVIVACVTTQYSLNTFASDLSSESGWYLRPIIGVSNLSDTTGTSVGLANRPSSANVQADSGFVAGLGIGYQYNNNISAELAWEYRTNDSSVKLDNGQNFASGDYASNIFMLNGFYHFNSYGKWRPYVGAGIMLVQEIDIDLVDAGQETSFSADGDIGAQIFAGLDYQLSDNLLLQTELRIGTLSDLNLDSENAVNASIDGLDYETTTLQIGLKYRFN